MSKSILPSRAKFLLCDDVRAETNGKITVVGLYPDDKILVNLIPGLPSLPGTVAVLNQIAIVCMLFDGDGMFPASATITGPSGLKLPSVMLGNPTFKPGTSATIVLNSGGAFPVPSYGHYKCVLTVDKQDFLFQFEIAAGPGAATPARPAAPVKKKSRRKA
jgi:hypothetical protein